MEVLPEIVDEGALDEKGESGYLGIGYDNLIPFLISAVKEQQQQIDSLRQEIELLKAPK